jgi:AhpD family alkylhydroperoxidase
MARLGFPNLDDDAGDVAGDVSALREGTLPNLYRMLLHSPRIAAGWLQLGTAVRYRSSLDDRLLELAICAVGRVCGCDYELAHHAPLARAAGATDEQLAALPDDLGGGRFTPREHAALRYVARVARLAAGDEAFAELAAHFSDAEIVELTATAAYYSGVARFLEALQIDLDEGLG